MRVLNFFVALVAAAFVAADSSNPITSPIGGSLQAGKPTTITWTPTNPGATITLVLRDGNSNNLNPGTTIISGIPNSGSYTWDVPAGVTQGSYTIEIKDSTGGDNFSPMFSVSSNAVSSGSSSSGTSKTTSSGSTSSTLSTSSTSSSSSSSRSSSSTSASSSSSRTSSSTSSATSRAPSNAAGGNPRTGAGSVAAVLGLGALVVLA